MIVAALIASLALAQQVHSADSADVAVGETMTAMNVGTLFQGTCLVPYSADQPPSALAAKWEELGKKAFFDKSFHIDGDGGAGCRIRYDGPKSDLAWDSVSGMLDRLATGRPDCASLKISTRERLLSCTGDAKAGMRRGEMKILRTTSSAVTATFTDLRP